jgi:hypothetical protein
MATAHKVQQIRERGELPSLTGLLPVAVSLSALHLLQLYVKHMNISQTSYVSSVFALAQLQDVTMLAKTVLY